MALDVSYRFNHTITSSVTTKQYANDVIDEMKEYLPTPETLNYIMDGFCWLVMFIALIQPARNIYKFLKENDYLNRCIRSKTFRQEHRRRESKGFISLVPLTDFDKDTFLEHPLQTPRGAKSKLLELFLSYWSTFLCLFIIGLQVAMTKFMQLGVRELLKEIGASQDFNPSKYVQGVKTDSPGVSS